MEITKARLKQIISEEINRMNEEGQNSYKMGDISEGEGMDMVQLFADLLFSSGLTAAESPQQARDLIMGLLKTAAFPAGVVAGGITVKSLVDAVKYLMDKGKDTQEK